MIDGGGVGIERRECDWEKGGDGKKMVDHVDGKRGMRDAAESELKETEKQRGADLPVAFIVFLPLVMSSIQELRLMSMGERPELLLAPS